MDEQNESIFSDLSNEFISDLQETCRVLLAIGMKGAGKTTIFVSFLKYALMNKWYDTYHLVIPTYKYEMSGAYKFLENQYQCFIYPTYTPMVTQRVLNDRKAQNKVLYMIDDASGFDMKDEHFKTLVTTSRHGKSKKMEHGGICLFLCVHSARRVMLPIIRQNCDYIFIFAMNNRKLLESLYEEYFSMIFHKFVDFLNCYKKAMKEKYNSILYSNQTQSLDANVKNWPLINDMKDVNHLEQTGTKKKQQNKDAKKDEDTKPTNQRNSIANLFRPIQFNKTIKFNK